MVGTAGLGALTRRLLWIGPVSMVAGSAATAGQAAPPPTLVRARLALYGWRRFRKMVA